MTRTKQNDYNPMKGKYTHDEICQGTYTNDSMVALQTNCSM